jgi:hypothetical protein
VFPEVPQTPKIMKVDSSTRKRKAAPGSKKSIHEGTVTDQYLHFISKTLNEEMKGFYLIMDNASITPVKK